ncbi:hypothetical protein BDV35DRAFT_116054 [Aspergillus flavus]|uniref:Uncharacterized protein n=1 Tax=Aspergillus flavus TaxID=5059 RepID=A0A5N6H9X8_ASPFL|nr:hypothetical protein BDV35DRAFT_116054 [Aspergillus flavus]
MRDKQAQQNTNPSIILLFTASNTIVSLIYKRMSFRYHLSRFAAGKARVFRPDIYRSQRRGSGPFPLITLWNRAKPSIGHDIT